MTTPTSCSVCGRTILKGERTRTYLTPDGEERTVCELCRARAEALEWVWSEDVDGHLPSPESRRRRGSLIGWLRGRARAAGQGAASASPAPIDGEPDPSPPQAPQQPPPPPRRSPDPAARGAGVGRAGVPEPGTRLERAVARFNESEHARTVAGLTRTLGEPQVSVGAAAGSPNEIRLTVAWELSWYQWAVDLGEPQRAVYEIDKGHEIDEIDAAARHWNAQVSGGEVRLGRPAVAAGEPARSES